MMSEQAQTLLQEIRDKWAAFQESPSSITIAGCISGMEKFAELDKMISEKNEYPISWGKI
ncbi:hypothetical protein SEA_TOMAS_281 [Streptomyces phage Tomas]|uniref:Uncharacterized protein n=1 Tax=Streptomyces phage Tomas TaxID=2914443 RepID=A0AA49H1N7_9CAUD|nr:hypothetical protein PP453_gp025 [Streptomyces phage Tomas]YP_010651363.1 hypothetical protein PP453_gp043 [Streptomyces phage Tomas]UMO76216.1 hypothetical protein SEA_TOMAS_25 [Streptomyces phage Tomas]UMO76424.1 hypothetical protein SEA_TOMAS_281 [Streptomyces phage Tomas]